MKPFTTRDPLTLTLSPKGERGSQFLPLPSGGEGRVRGAETS